MEDVAQLGVKTISPIMINKILTKYNKTIESLVIWLYHNGNNPDRTYGLTWDDDDDGFDFDSDYNSLKQTGVDSDGARDFND